LLIEVHVDWDTFSDEERAQFNNDTRQLIRTVMKQVRKEIAQEDR
jgi:ribosomal protein S20